MASPTAPATSCVPLRRRVPAHRRTARLEDDPRRQGERADTDRSPDLVRAETDTMSAPAVTSARSSHGAACTASVNTYAWGARRLIMCMRSARGWSTPVSLLAVMMATAVTRDDSMRARRVGVDDAGGVDGELVRLQPGFRRGAGRLTYGRVFDGGVSSTASPRTGRAASAGPSTARLADSVPPEVKTISPGSRPRKAATSSRASSSSRRARCAAGWLPVGLPNTPSPASTSAMAAATSGRSGAVAAWSR